MRIAYVDTETTGTGRQHVAWEVAVVIEEDWETVSEHVWQVQIHALERMAADRDSLEIGGYFERYVEEEATQRQKVGSELRGLIDDQTRLASCNVAFDTRYLEKIVGFQTLAPAPWHYSPIDVKSVCYGARPHLLGAKTADLAKSFGVVMKRHHTAMHDALVARLLLHRAMGR
jgi:DNA polymerase III alpha subunit (gram-positive type)